VNEAESLERGLVLAALDALRQVEGDAIVRVILERAAASDLEGAEARRRVPFVDYLRYRDAAVDCLGESFRRVAFETGRTLVRNLNHRKIEEVGALIRGLGAAASKLTVIGQAAVLAAAGNPGEVRASQIADTHLVLTISDCPECRGLEHPTPFCFLNQGIVTEFARRYLDAVVRTEETACAAMGAPACRIEVWLSQ
jgi:divinyl protochlorophyllide a 8-vinyl-reductase